MIMDSREWDEAFTVANIQTECLWNMFKGRTVFKNLGTTDETKIREHMEEKTINKSFSILLEGIKKQWAHHEMFEKTINAGWHGKHEPKKKNKTVKKQIEKTVSNTVPGNKEAELLAKIKELEENNLKLKTELEQLKHKKEEVKEELNIIRLNDRIRKEEYKDSIVLTGIGTKEIKNQLKMNGFRWNPYQKEWSIKKCYLKCQII